MRINKLLSHLVRCYVWSFALYGSEIWTLRKLERKYLESLEMWCWRRMEKVTNEQVLVRIGEKRELLNNILSVNANWISHIVRRNSLHDAIEVKGVGRRRRRRTQLLDDLRNRTRYWELKEGSGRSKEMKTTVYQSNIPKKYIPSISPWTC